MMVVASGEIGGIFFVTKPWRYLELDEIDRQHSGTETDEGWSGEGDGSGERRQQRKQQLDWNDDSVLMEERAGQRNGDGRRRQSKRGGVGARVETAIDGQRRWTGGGEDGFDLDHDFVGVEGERQGLVEDGQAVEDMEMKLMLVGSTGCKSRWRTYGGGGGRGF
ncbi:hypothetical protein J1N35_008580 [Gossypium stocksii]|uniref:Uncharacterized protein n=1 Tax=Gossypium stocksii TaxID=47602 RepID=A0A9D3W9P5_9ROSI|nr:hypothetical protein J1N35_008580 [Gossypium stocksii]